MIENVVDFFIALGRWLWETEMVRWLREPENVPLMLISLGVIACVIYTWREGRHRKKSR